MAKPDPTSGPTPDAKPAPQFPSIDPGITSLPEDGPPLYVVNTMEAESLIWSDEALARFLELQAENWARVFRFYHRIG